MKSYTSPHSGKTYEIVEVSQSRAHYRIPGEKSSKCVRNYLEYHFYYEGKRVTWTLDLNLKNLSNTFGEIEGIFASWESSPWD